MLLLVRHCTPAVVPGLSADPETTLLMERASQGPFDKGTQYETKDQSITIDIPASHFCGDEPLINVAQRVDPTQVYNTTLNYYLEDLRNANVDQRKAMLLANLRNAKGQSPDLCTAPAKAGSRRQLLSDPRRHSRRRTWILTLVKLGVLSISSFGITTIMRERVGNGTSPAVTSAGFTTAVVADVLINALIDDINERQLPADLRSVDEWKAMGIVMFCSAISSFFGVVKQKMLDSTKRTGSQAELIPSRASSVEGSGRGRNNLPFRGNHQNSGSSSGSTKRQVCQAAVPASLFEDTLNILGNADGGNDLNIRPQSLVDAINDAPTKDACPGYDAWAASGISGGTGL